MTMDKTEQKRKQRKRSWEERKRERKGQRKKTHQQQKWDKTTSLPTGYTTCQDGLPKLLLFFLKLLATQNVRYAEALCSYNVSS